MTIEDKIAFIANLRFAPHQKAIYSLLVSAFYHYRGSIEDFFDNTEAGQAAYFAFAKYGMAEFAPHLITRERTERGWPICAASMCLSQDRKLSNPHKWDAELLAAVWPERIRLAAVEAEDEWM